MSNEILAVVSLFVLRLGVPLLVSFAVGTLLTRWDSRRAAPFARP